MRRAVSLIVLFVLMAAPTTAAAISQRGLPARSLPPCSCGRPLCPKFCDASCPCKGPTTALYMRLGIFQRHVVRTWPIFPRLFIWHVLQR
jgi:hypothetical protein